MTTKSSAHLQGNPNQETLADAENQENIQGQSVFHIQTAAAGVVVTTVFVTSDGQVLQLPAVFPSLAYGLEQIDALRQHVIDHFAHAAQVGVQVIAANSVARDAGNKNETLPESVAAIDPGLLN